MLFPPRAVVERGLVHVVQVVDVEPGVPGDEMVDGDEEALEVVSGRERFPSAGYRPAMTKVKQQKRVGIRVDEKVSAGNALVGKAALQVEVVDDGHGFVEPLALELAAVVERSVSNRWGTGSQYTA